jgi:RNA polymerase sigma-70 factor, ECF subfamily
MNPPDSQRLAAFEALMLPHLDAAYNLARWLTRDDADAQDVVQEAYLRALRFFSSFTGAGGRAWLLAIVRNTAYSWMQRHRQTLVAFDENEHLQECGAPVAEAELLLQARRESLEACIGELPPPFREIVVLRELEDMSYREVAEAVGVPVGTVMSRLARARDRLRRCITGKLQ